MGELYESDKDIRILGQIDYNYLQVEIKGKTTPKFLIDDESKYFFHLYSKDTQEYVGFHYDHILLDEYLRMINRGR